MDYQDLFNVAITLCGALVGWFMKAVWQSLRDLREADLKLADKVAQIEILVAGQYVKRDDFERTAAAIFSKLDKIYDRLETKVDKDHK